MKWGLKGGISIDTDSGLLGYVLWCCSSRSWEVFTFFRLALAILCEGHLGSLDDMTFLYYFRTFRLAFQERKKFCCQIIFLFHKFSIFWNYNSVHRLAKFGQPPTSTSQRSGCCALHYYLYSSPLDLHIQWLCLQLWF